MAKTDKHLKRWRLLITRPAKDSARSALKLREMGQEVVICPMLTISPLLGAKPRLHAALSENVQAIIFTSANAIRLFSNMCDERNVPIYCVGDSSAYVAKQQGFTTIYSASGDVEDLQELITKSCKQDKGKLVHIAGSVQAGDLKTALESKGFSVERILAYEAKPAEMLPDAARTALLNCEIDAVLFYSKRSMQIFEELLLKAKLDYLAKDIEALALPSKVSTLLTWRSVRCAKAPNEEALFALIDAQGSATIPKEQP